MAPQNPRPSHSQGALVPSRQPRSLNRCQRRLQHQVWVRPWFLQLHPCVHTRETRQVTCFQTAGQDRHGRDLPSRGIRRKEGSGSGSWASPKPRPCAGRLPARSTGLGLGVSLWQGRPVQDDLPPSGQPTVSSGFKPNVPRAHSTCVRRRPESNRLLSNQNNKHSRTCQCLRNECPGWCWVLSASSKKTDKKGSSPEHPQCA